MGTWGYGINDNDTSFDVTETFFEKYNEGIEPDMICDDILKQFAYSLNDSEDSDNVFFPLAQCLWETCALTDAMLVNIQERIKTDGNIEVLKGLGAEDDFLVKRRALLNKFLSKISCQKEKPKARKKPPVKIETDYQAGSCLSFRYPDGSFGGAIVISADLFNTKGSIFLAITTIRSSKSPSFQDFECSKMIDFQWDMVSGQSERYAAVKINGNSYTGRVGQRCCNYSKKQERTSYFLTFAKLFTVVGKLPQFTQILCATTWINMAVGDVVATLDFYYHLQGQEYCHVSDLSLSELAKLLSICCDRNLLPTMEARLY